MLGEQPPVVSVDMDAVAQWILSDTAPWAGTRCAFCNATYSQRQGSRKYHCGSYWTAVVYNTPAPYEFHPDCDRPVRLPDARRHMEAA